MTERVSIQKNQELTFIIALTAVSTAVGLFASFDLELAKLFFNPASPLNPWPQKDDPVWKFFYHAAPLITGGILFPSIIIYIASYLKKSVAKYRRHAAYVFLAALLGPGILINTIFKPYWGRPRPRQVIELGGTQKMNAFWEKGKAGNGYSFPCGHSSVGFALVSFYFLIKRRRPKVAKAVFAGSFTLGMVMGVGRMADGAHFFSDVLWSAVMSYIPAYFLYYKMRLYEDYRPEFERDYKKALLQGGVLFALLLVAVLVATPYGKNTKYVVEGSELLMSIDEGTVEFLANDSLESPFKITVKARGFGFPESELVSKKENNSLSFNREGYFSDFEANYIIMYSPEASKIVIQPDPDLQFKNENPLK